MEIGSAIRTEIGGVSVVELAREFGTPLYVYDEKKILEQISQLRRFDTIRFAQKACSNIAVLHLMRKQGVVVDAVSAGEIHRALAAGYQPVGDPPPIVYCADIFDRDSLDLVVLHNIHVNCGSIDMIEQLGSRVQDREITLRINPGFGHGHSRKTNTGGELSKHGIWHQQLQQAITKAEQLRLKVVGLHMHIGSGTDLEHLARVCTAMERVANEAGPRVRYISAGGGLPIPYRPEDEPLDLDRYFQLWDETRRRLEQSFGHPVRLEVEPGRFLVAEAGFLVTEVRAVKQQASNVFYLVDAGFNNLARPVLYGAFHPITLCPADGNCDRPLVEAVVGGPLCESGDIFTQSEGGFVEKRLIPQAHVGDYLVIEKAGAYGFVMGSNYNSKPLAAEVLIRNGRPILIRRRQSYDQLIRDETIPQDEN